MRTPEQKQHILDRLESTRRVENVVSQDNLKKLLDVYENSEKIVKTTGPTTVNYNPNHHGYPEWIKTVEDIITPYIGDHTIYFANFFDVTYPHIIHNDDSSKFYDLYKTVVIPLALWGHTETKFGVFDQCYLDGPVKIRHGGKFKGERRYGERHNKPKVHFNQDLLDNSVLINYTGKDFDKQTWEDNFTHQPYERYHGLSLESMNIWRPSDIIIFDGARLHCAGDFLKQGITRKIGLSIFTCI